MAVTLNLHDLEFILKQIQIAEAHSNGTALTEIRVNPLTGEIVRAADQYDANGMFLGDQTWARAIPDPKTPFGLRTVDGSYNNIVEGREYWGAADQPMPRLLDPRWINENDGDTMPLGPGATVTNNNYGANGSVADADPRIISNLVVDMSLNNPAAIVAALTFAGRADPYADLQALQALRGISVADADQRVSDAQTALTAATTALQTAITSFDGSPG